MNYTSMTEVRRANREAGHHFFDPATIRFFNGTVGRTLYHGRYFITSEQAPYNPRHWTIRIAKPNGRIDTFGEFGKYASYNEARKALRSLVSLRERNPEEEARLEAEIRQHRLEDGRCLICGGSLPCPTCEEKA
jgi:hypothetical protein